MTQTAELTVETNHPILLGSSVAMSGALVLSGAPRDTIGNNFEQGAFWGYEEPATGWVNASTPNLSRTSSDGAKGDEFASSLAVSGTSIIVGAPDHAVNGKSKQGVVYVFGPKP